MNYGPDLDCWTFLDSNLHTRLANVTENELGLAFPPGNLPKKFRPDPSMFYLVIVVTDKQMDKQTYAGDSIIPCESFRGDNKLSVYFTATKYLMITSTKHSDAINRKPTICQWKLHNLVPHTTEITLWCKM